MFTKKQPYQFKDQITVDFLQTSCINHQEIAEELALSEIHSMELAMPKFNTVASLNKTEFNKLLSNIKRRYKETQAFTVMVAAMTDTFTCMIQNNKFYDNFIGDNKNGLELMIDLLHTIKLLLVTYHRAVETKQLQILIDILEKSAERIRNKTQHYEIMQQIISSLKTHMQNQLNKENKKEIKEVDTKIELQVKNRVEQNSFLFHENGIKENAKLPPPTINTKKVLVLNNNNVTSNNVDFKMDCTIITEDENPPTKSVQEQVNNATLLAAPVKQEIVNKRPANAFELMMMSSKNLAVKRKRTM